MNKLINKEEEFRKIFSDFNEATSKLRFSDTALSHIKTADIQSSLLEDANKFGLNLGTYIFAQIGFGVWILLINNRTNSDIYFSQNGFLTKNSLVRLEMFLGRRLNVWSFF